MAGMNESLAAVEADIVGRLGKGISPFFEAQVDAGAQHLKATNVPGVGNMAPSFVLPGTSGTPVGLTDLIANGPAILLFLRGDW